MAHMQGNHNDVIRLPPSRSHSQLVAYLECPRRYQLEKAARIPRRPGPWFPGGTAVHATIERYLRETLKEESS